MRTEYHPVASFLVKTPDGYVAIREGKDCCMGEWGLPQGTVERGETVIEAARRKAGTEAGIEAVPEAFCGVFQDSDHESGSEVFVVVLSAEIVCVDPDASGDESVMEAALLEEEEFLDRNMRFEYVREAIKNHEAGIKAPLELFQDFR
ncbi:MAG: NUDIX hydrolase [Candidatus Nanohaloarchaea archaeon]